MKPTTDMTTSPYDRAPAPPPEPTLVQLGYTTRPRWVPSRFNARTVFDDGRLMLWNTLSGSITIFPAEKRERVIAYLSRAGVSGPLRKGGQYLEERGYLVRDSVDEMQLFRLRYARQQWRSDVLELILLASEDCNFRCVYCYEKFRRGTMSPETRQGVRNLVLRRAGELSTLNISWFGGEPLYGWDAVQELAPFFSDVAAAHGIAHRQAMTTNAYLLTPDRAERLLAWGCRDYQITIDGLAADHDCKRVGRDGSPTHATILENLRAMKRMDEQFRVTVRVNFDRENLPGLVTFLEDLGEDFGGDPRFGLRFRAVGRWGGPNDDALSTCGVDEQRSALATLRKKAEEADLGQEGGIRGAAHFGSQVCYAARPYNFIVGASGKLMKCTIALEDLEENVVGKLLPDGTLELDDARLATWVSPHFENDTLCKSCYALPICQGVSCPLTRIEHGHRTCCSVKPQLKNAMRFTMAETDRLRAASAEMAVAGG